MKKRDGFCLIPVLFGLAFVVFIFLVIVIVITDLFLSSTVGNESFKDFEDDLIDEYGIEYADVYIDTDAIEIYFTTSENVSIEEAREILAETRDYMLVDENYEPFLEQFQSQNYKLPKNVRVRFEPYYSVDYYYQFSAPSFKSTSWLFESKIDDEYHKEYYEIFDFVKSTLFNKKFI